MQKIRPLLMLACGAMWLPAQVLAQTGKSPFSVGAEQGGGNVGGIAGWILAQQNAFYLALKADVLAATHNGSAGWTLAGLSFAYGVFHAAGPGHGKAVVASYMLANEQALRRGLVLSLLAALLQGAVAIALVATAIWAFNATARHMNDAATLIEELSYVGIIALGVWLTWTKGRAFWAALPKREVPQPDASHGHHDHSHHDHGNDHRMHDDHAHIHDEHCGHFHAPDAKTLGPGFSWRGALATIVVAGSRPCSGAILVLAFTAAQGIFWIGLWSVLAMSLGTALTTGALAAMAVLAKGAALRFSNAESGQTARWVAGLELLAAIAVALVGAGLLAGATMQPGLG